MTDLNLFKIGIEELPSQVFEDLSSLNILFLGDETILVHVTFLKFNFSTRWQLHQICFKTEFRRLKQTTEVISEQ